MKLSNASTMRFSLLLRASVLALAVVGWMAAPALAAPAVLVSDPAEGEQFTDPPEMVTIDFSEPLQAASAIKVVDDCGLKVSVGKGDISGPLTNQLSATIDEAPHHGTYTIRYVATGVTGTTVGKIRFVVHGGVPCDDGAATKGGAGMEDHPGMSGGDRDSDGSMDMGSDSGSGMSMGGSTSGDMSTAMSQMGTGTAMGAGGMARGDMDRDDMGSGGMANMNDEGTQMGHDDNELQAAGRSTGVTSVPTGATVVIALGLASLMGLFGGWVLRVSNLA